MYYLSTRDASLRRTSSQVIAQGLSREGGLFLPDHIPALPPGTLEAMGELSYPRRAALVMAPYLDGFSPEELNRFAERAYGGGKFDDPDVAPLHRLDERTYCLELWHGPTCAFKDMALQLLPHLLTASLAKNGEERTACILVATSGDTGKAALEGFRDVEGTRIMVFYPKDGVSEVQQLQMMTQQGDNVGVCAVAGNFDDAQTGVKKLFSDEALREDLSRRGYFLSSANSINWGRVLPQMVYYISAYADLLRQGAIRSGEKINICVPTGNFGNILAAYYAARMGLPVKKLICASNRNNVLTDFLHTGVYDRNRPFHATVSPSMDILISSNLERLLFLLSGGEDAAVSDCMARLAAEGRYEVSGDILAKIQTVFAAGFADEEETRSTIGSMWREKDYLIDTHTAVAFHVLDRYRRDTGDDTCCVVASTASPFKFGDVVLASIGAARVPAGTAALERLSAETGISVPAPLASLRSKPVRFNRSVKSDAMERVVTDFLH